ncbi:MAG: DUF4116 domain-containing protein [Rickettsiales bacterium]|nr:DUF4116 domain-containing protein [Rickettsiales bacterium]
MKSFKLPTLLVLFILFSCAKPLPKAPRVMQFDVPRQKQFSILDKYKCDKLDDILLETAIVDIKEYDIDLISKLPNCFRGNRKLILKAILIDPSQFRHATDTLRSDKNFIRHLIKIDPRTLAYASDKVRSDPVFMERATFLSRDSLQYATPKLRDNKLFMHDMIDNDSRNYIYASNRLKEEKEFAEMAFSDNGMLLVHAPQKIKKDPDLVRIAFKSSSLSIKYADESLRKKKEFILEEEDYTTRLPHAEMVTFIHDNYVIKSKDAHLGFRIGNRAKFSKDNIIVDKNYVVKWQRALDRNINRTFSKYSLIAVESRNLGKKWQDDFVSYPELVNKIERFFLKREVDQITINNLETTYLWKISDKPLTLLFNLYLLRNNSNLELGENFSNVTSLTAIVQKKESGWRLSVVEVIFDSEIEMKVEYDYGHKKYMIWDLYNKGIKEETPLIIFQTQEGFKKYFDIYHEKTGGKFEMIYRVEAHEDY